MAKLVALNPEYHKHLKINTEKLEAQGASERLVPVVLSEFSKLIVQYPIVLTKSEESGEFVCVAVLGFEKNENLFWQHNSWGGIYTPLNVIRQPFFIGKDQDKNIICIDEESPCISDNGGVALFNEDGSESTFLRDVQKMLVQLLESEQHTRNFIALLVEYDLLVTMPLNITFTNGENKNIRGFYTIDEEKVASLDQEKLVNLQKEKYLAPLHILIASTGHIYSLVARKNALLAQQQEAVQ